MFLFVVRHEYNTVLASNKPFPADSALVSGHHCAALAFVESIITFAVVVVWILNHLNHRE